MKELFSQKILNLAKKSPKPLYAVGGFVRDYLIDKSVSNDVDICADISAQDFCALIKSQGITPLAEYKHTGTVMFISEGKKYEFTSFREEKYHSGEHTPYSVKATGDIVKDALRRDFKCNAVYYDITNGKIVDPLCGVADIKAKILSAVSNPYQVFSFDGLRLMRLARFSGELGFDIEKTTEEGARANADKIDYISSERIYEELKKILTADFAHGFSPVYGQYIALKTLDRIGVLERLIPELTAGRGMAQRADYHAYDVLEHSFRTVMYADKRVRLAAFLHDVGKPYCKNRFGKYHKHAIAGEIITKEVLKRLKAPKKDVDFTAKLVRFHMVDIECNAAERDIRRFIVAFGDVFSPLMQLKNADYRAGSDKTEKSPTVSKWEKIYGDMVRENTPFSLSDLKISARALKDMGYGGEKIKKELNVLMRYAIDNPEFNDEKTLEKKAEKDLRDI